MANHRHVHLSTKENKDTGFGTNATSNSSRFLNKDGSMNQHREGISFFDKFSEKLSVVINLFNFDMKEPELDIFHKIKKGKAGEPNDEMGFVLKDGNFYIVYHQEMVLGLYEKQKK